MPEPEEKPTPDEERPTSVSAGPEEIAGAHDAAAVAEIDVAEDEAYDTELLVLGSGPGGYAAAFRAADLGLKVTLVERYEHRVFSFCARMLSDRTEAEDVAQDVFLNLYRNAGEFRGDSAFSTWLFRIAKNQTLNRIKYLERRGRSARRADDGAEERLARLADEGARAADEVVADGQRAQLVQDAISSLQEDHRAVVVLRDMEDLSYEEISDITGLPLGTVKSRIHRARSALAKRLSRFFV